MSSDHLPPGPLTLAGEALYRSADRVEVTPDQLEALLRTWWHSDHPDKGAWDTFAADQPARAWVFRSMMRDALVEAEHV